MATEIIQGTAEWLAERRGNITSSRMASVASTRNTDSGGIAQAAKTYAYEIIAHELIGESFSFHNEATEWGTNAEGIARHFYASKTGYNVREVGFMESDIKGYGGSPDGIIYADMGSEMGIVEFKCPFNPGIHIKHCMIKKDTDIPRPYYWQCQSNIYVSGALWCDFVSFDPRINSDLGMFIYRLYRNQTDIDKMLKKVELTKEFIAEIKEQLGIK